MIFGVAWAWGIALAIWVVQSNWKLPFRLLIILLFYQCLFVMGTMLLHRYHFDLTLICCIWTSILLLCWSLAHFHFKKSRTTRNSERQSRPSINFTLRGLLLWMAIFAGYLAFLMQIRWPNLSPSDYFNSLVNSFVALAVAITTWWSTQRPAYRVLFVPLTIAIAIAFETWWTQDMDETVWFFTCRFAIIAGIVALSFVKLPLAVSRQP